MRYVNQWAWMSWTLPLANLAHATARLVGPTPSPRSRLTPLKAGTWPAPETPGVTPGRRAGQRMQLLIDILEWLLIAVGAVLVIGVVIFAALAFRLNHPPGD